MGANCHLSPQLLAPFQGALPPDPLGVLYPGALPRTSVIGSQPMLAMVYPPLAILDLPLIWFSPTYINLK